jgi:hypothetical protein
MMSIGRGLKSDIGANEMGFFKKEAKLNLLFWLILILLSLIAAYLGPYLFRLFKK